jgi:DNA-binding MarR family transcriptional regulator
VCAIHTFVNPAAPPRATRPLLLQHLDEVLFDIRRVFQRSTYRKRMLRGLSYDVELATLRLMRAIQRADGPPSIGEVAEGLAIAPSTASRLVDQAVDSGYVERLSVDGDRRRTSLRLSSTGGTVLDELNVRRRQLLAEVTADWDDGDLEELTRLLSILQADFEGLRPR